MRFREVQVVGREVWSGDSMRVRPARRIAEMPTQELDGISAMLERHFKFSVMGILKYKRAFCCIHGVNERTMRALKMLAAEGTARNVHGNLQQTPHNILSAEVIQSISSDE